MSAEKQPEQFGPYTIIEEIADGTIARLCRAVHAQAGQHVLLRILHPLVSKNERLRALLEEMRDPLSKWRISDPAVLRILGVGKLGESYFIACEDFDGVPLDEFLSKGRPTLSENLSLALLMAESLRAVHARRIIHGDIKPSNFLIGRNHGNRFTVKLAMADLAHTATDAMISIYGDLVGTPKYMAPEQIRGRRMTQASDLFALGIVFYEMFSGRQPFPAGSPLGYLQSNLQASARPLAMVDTAVPVAVSQVVERMLQKDPAQRYRRTEHLVDDLERAETLLEGTAPVSAPPGADSVFAASLEPVSAQSSGPWRAVAVTALAMSVLLFAALLFVLVPYFTRRPKYPAPNNTIVQNPKPEPKTEPEPSPKPVEQPLPVKKPAPKPKPPAPQPATRKPLQGALDEVCKTIQADKFAEAARQITRIRALYTTAQEQEEIRQVAGSAFLSRGEMLHQNKQDDEALAAYKQLVGVLPGTQWAKQADDRGAAILLRRINISKSKADLLEAVTTLEELTREFPATDAAKEALRDLPFLRAQCAEAMLPVDPDRAIKLLRESASSAPSSQTAEIRKKLAAALSFRAQGLMRQQKYAEALTDLSDARSTDAAVHKDAARLEPEILYLHAKNLKQQGNFEQALAVWAKLRKDYASSKWTALGTREGLGELAKAVGPEHGGNADILMKMALDRIAANQRDDARKLLLELVRKYPESEPAIEAAETLAQWELAEGLKRWRTDRETQGLPLLQNIIKNYPGTKAAGQAAQHIKRYEDTPENMVLVPGGEFMMGLDKASADKLAHTFKVPRPMRNEFIGSQTLNEKYDVRAFYIDRHEVTNAQYQAFVKATGAGAPQSDAWSGKEIRKGLENCPVTNVTFAEAAAYATWAKKRLPTEQEWEKAARGTDGRIFPWGNQFVPEHTVTSARTPPARQAQPVGSAPGDLSPYGAFDLAGNVQEWTQSIFKPHGEAAALSDRTVHRVVRGAAFNEPDGFLTTATVRHPAAENLRKPSLGFRCVKDIK